MTEQGCIGILLLTVEEVAELLKISPKTIYKGTAPKTASPLPFKVVHPLGNKLIRFRASDIIAYVDGLLGGNNDTKLVHVDTIKTRTSFLVRGERLRREVPKPLEVNFDLVHG